MQAIDDDAFGRSRHELSLDRIGELAPAIDRHAQPVIVFAVVRIGDKLIEVAARVEASDRNAQPQHEKRECSLGKELESSQPKRGSRGLAGARFKIEPTRWPHEWWAAFRHGARHVRAVLDQPDDILDQRPVGGGLRCGRIEIRRLHDD